MGSKLRDGYYIDVVTIANDQIIVLLKQPWQPGITMEYSVTTVSPTHNLYYAQIIHVHLDVATRNVTQSSYCINWLQRTIYLPS